MGRAYDNERRAEAARRTRRRILDTAQRLLLDAGYAAMTVGDLAREAEVSPQTVYNSVGGKAAVVKAVYDVLLAGDDEPVPMSERPQFAAMARAETVAEFVAAYASWCRTISERVGPFLAALAPHGPGGDPELDDFLATLERERRTGSEHAMTALFRIEGRRSGTAIWRRTVDAVWTLNAPEVYDRLVRRCGWTATDYERWIRVQLMACLDPGAGRGPRPR